MHNAVRTMFSVSAMSSAIGWAAIVIVLGIIPAGCAAIQNRKAIEMEQESFAAGWVTVVGSPFSKGKDVL